MLTLTNDDDDDEDDDEDEDEDDDDADDDNHNEGVDDGWRAVVDDVARGLSESEAPMLALVAEAIAERGVVSHVLEQLSVVLLRLSSSLPAPQPPPQQQKSQPYSSFRGTISKRQATRARAWTGRMIVELSIDQWCLALADERVAVNALRVRRRRLRALRCQSADSRAAVMMLHCCVCLCVCIFIMYASSLVMIIIMIIMIIIIIIVCSSSFA
eukprot:3939221-Rhodomonas_salina.1